MKPNSPKSENPEIVSTMDDELVALGDQLRSQALHLAASYPATVERLERPTPVQRSTSASWVTMMGVAVASLAVGVAASSVWQTGTRDSLRMESAPRVSTAPGSRSGGMELAPAGPDPVVNDKPSVDEVVRSLTSADADSPLDSEMASPEEKIRLLERAVESYRSAILYQQEEIRRLREELDKLRN